ncbi:MAG: hypothetical protein QOH35_2769 [Acidobacteriaceae bacterium]|nr:hypothetical protein [Acidobacteriaceae bacterium]MEA2541403.1 hypothetical protein [Acidobacteriaceae bacterium]
MAVPVGATLAKLDATTSLTTVLSLSTTLSFVIPKRSRGICSFFRFPNTV